MRTVDLKCRDVHAFMNGGMKEGLQKLDLDPQNFGRLSGQVRTVVEADLLCHYPVQFEMTVLVPLSELVSVQKAFKRRGCVLSRTG
jgi:hypothetical protein